MTSVIDLKARFDEVRSNPAAMQRIGLSLAEGALNGTLDIVDPSNPFVLLMEASAVMSSVAIAKNDVNNRKQYPSVAETQDEVYLHMADVDFANRFVTPTRTSFTILLGKDELYQRAVETGIGTIRKLTIARNSEFTIAGYKFTMQYPIDIRIMSHGGLQIVYDVSKTSPLETLESNVVDWGITRIDGIDFVTMNVPVSQFEITTVYEALSPAAGFSKTFDLIDQFYYCRAFLAASDGTWKEIHTTHTDQVFDPNEPTLLLKVYEKTLKVEMPAIYFSNNTAEGELRIDIYTSKGPLELILGNYAINAFSARWRDIEGEDGGKFTAPLSAFSTIAVYSDKSISGGSNSLTFDELRARVMNNALGTPDLPITNAQLTSTLSNLGYSLVKNIDNITNRQFLATTDLPAPTDGSVSTGIGCSIRTLSLVIDHIRSLETVRDNDERITLLPSTLYEDLNGVMAFVPKNRVDELLALSLDARATAINANHFAYSPFHYVLDITNDSFDLRPYYLDKPTIPAKYFIEENDTTEVAVSLGKYTLTRIDSGYKLVVALRSGDSFKVMSDDSIFVQASFRPYNEVDRAYLNGTLIGKLDEERVYEFLLNTNYDIDDADNIYLTNFKMYDDSPRTVGAPLLTDLDIVVVLADHQPVDQVNSDIDTMLGRFLLPETVVGAVRERLKLRLGYSLPRLWANCRSVISSMQYRKYEADVPYLYSENIYKRDPATGTLEFTINPTSGAAEFILEHAKDDPVLNDEGQPLYLARKGDNVLDAEGNPIPVSTRGMLRHIDLLFFDGTYYFATESNSVAYRDSVPETIAGWLVDDLTNISKRLLEQTKIYFYPKATLGTIDVIVGEGLRTSIYSEQSFSVRFLVTATTYANAPLRQAMSKAAVETINEILTRTTVSVTDIQSKLKARVGEDALSIDISGFGNEGNLTAFTVTDDSVRGTIRKRLIALPDGTLAVQDDVSVDFVRHDA